MSRIKHNPDYVSIKLQGDSVAVQRMLEVLVPVEDKFTRFKRAIKIGTNPLTKSDIVAAYLEIPSKNFADIIKSNTT